MRFLPISTILDTEPDAGAGREIGRSRAGRPLRGHLLGSGPVAVSLIAGCHADEPVGPEMLDRLVAFLATLPPDHPALTRLTWAIVPHANPDGDAVNAAWSRITRPLRDARGATDRGFDLSAYLRHVVRELPGDDVEFGFPRDADDGAARPENRAIAAFLSRSAPHTLHGSFHGMAFAPGPWFLIEPSWIDRTGGLRDALRRRVAEMGYEVFDVDRGGEKGFSRIDEGFSTRPDSRAMVAFFEHSGDPETAALFRPSSMELVRRWSRDAFTFVSEMPLFVRPAIARTDDPEAPPSNVGSDNRRRFHTWLRDLVAGRSADEAHAEAARHGIRPMPIRDQMRLQLELLDEALRAVGRSAAARLLAAILLGVSLFFAAACSTSEPRPGVAAPSGLRGPRPVVLITLDTTRADHLAPYGADRAASPHLAQLAQSGVVFERAYAVTPITLPSHASILTGLDPRQHGVRNNEIHRLADDIPTLAERLAAEGYRTAAFVSAAVLERRYGLARGFETYDDRWEDSADPTRPVAERPAASTVAAARGWLDEREEGELFLLWVHLYDPHAAYDPPAAFAERHPGDPYTGEIAYMDSEIGRLLDHPLLRPDVSSNPPIVMAIGDHGEGLGEHGEETHGLLIYDSTLRIPWIARLPQGPAGARVEWAVSQIDLMPTVLDLLGLLRPGRDADLPGRSLLELLTTDAPPTDSTVPVDQLHGRFLYAESHAAFHLYGWARQQSLRRERFKFIDSPLPELYDVQSDPGELDNLIVAEPRIAGLLSKRLARLTSGPGPKSAEGPALDSASRARLRALGYLSSGVERRPGPDDRRRLDPKEMMPIHQAVNRAERSLAEGRLEESLEVLDGVIEADPSNIIALRYRGEALWSLGRHDEAAGAFEAALEAEPENALVTVRLAILEGLRQDPQRALDLTEAALEIDPRMLEGRLERARFLDRLGRSSEARPLIEQAFAEAPDDPWVNLRYAQLIEIPDGDYAAAEVRLRALLEADPEMGEAWWLLAESLRLAGRDRSAVAAAREGLSHLPSEGRLHAHLGKALAASGDDQAETHLRAALRLSARVDPELFNILADWLAARGRNDEAEAIWQQAASSTVSGPAARNERAIALFNSGREEEAIAVWRELSTEHPEFAPALSNLAAVRLARRDWRSAESLAHRAVELDPSLAAAWSTLGAALLEQSRWQESAAALQRAFRLDPTDWQSGLYAGRILAQLRRFTEAAEAYEAVLRQRPDEPSAHYELGLLFSEPLDDPERARFHLLAGLAAQPDHPRSELARDYLANDR